MADSTADAITMKFDQNFDSSGGLNKTSLINSHNINLNPSNFENDDIITLNVGGIKVFDILTFIKKVNYNKLPT